MGGDSAQLARRLELTEKVRAMLLRTQLLTEDGALAPMDSLGIVVLCTDLENELGLEMRPTDLQLESFASFESLMEAVFKCRPLQSPP